MGVEVHEKEEQLFGNCVSCGIQLALDQVEFLSPSLSRLVIKEFEELIPEGIHQEVRYSWVSSKTVGIIFELSREEVADCMDIDLLEQFEDQMNTKYEIFLTVYYE
jgi:hypothetical protein